MDVDKYAPFTSSPLDSSRGRGRRMMFPRLRPSTTFRSAWKPEAAASTTTATVVVVVSPQQQQTQTTSTTAQQTPQPQVGGSTNGKK